jgi:hypothetical protein
MILLNKITSVQIDYDATQPYNKQQQLFVCLSCVTSGGDIELTPEIPLCGLS